MAYFAAIEAGGTKFVCGIGTGPHDLVSVHIPTTTPKETVAACVNFFRRWERVPLTALGIGSFGPVDRERGVITSTPKPGWRNCDLAGLLRTALDIPIIFDTDVNAALVGEARWGASRDIANCLYLTVGTGIGGAALVSGHLIHGTSHAEIGHLRVPRVPEDVDFAGVCPFHGDCLEGIASGTAIATRCGRPGETLAADHPVWRMEARYLALALANLTFTLSPERIIVGGGVMQQPYLLQMIRDCLAALLNGYVATPEVMLPGLGNRSGVLGALGMAGAGLC